MKKITLLFFIAFIASSCSDNNKLKEKKIKDDIEKNSGVIIPSFKFVESTTESGGGDYTHTFTLKFDSLEFQNIVSQIRNSKYFMNILNPPIPSNDELKNSMVKRWSLAQFGYRFEYFIDGTDKFLEYEFVVSDYTLHGLYIEE